MTQCRLRSAGRSGTSVSTSTSLSIGTSSSISVKEFAACLAAACPGCISCLPFFLVSISAQCSERSFGQSSFQLSDLWCHAKRVDRIMRNAHTVFIFCYNYIIIVSKKGYRLL